MSLVLVEREFETPPVFAELQAREDAFSWCLENNGVTFLHTYVSRDGRKMVCVYEAPDAESVRVTQRTASLPVSDIWTARRYRGLMGEPTPPLPPGKTLVMVERRFDAEQKLDALSTMVAEGKWCYDANDIDFLDSYTGVPCTRTLCMFAAPDAESVRRADATLSSPYERIWPATVVTPDAG